MERVDMILDLVSDDAAILRLVQPDWDWNALPCDPIELAKNLADTMIAKNALGIAAPQVGLPYRVFAIKSNPVLVCFNPRIVDQTAKGIVLLEEGCLTFPNLFIKIKRPKSIKVRFELPNKETITQKFTGITARCFQHELDHLNGMLYTSRASSFHVEQGRRLQKKLNRRP